MIIGTAGHIDHGKTALVKALTGIDTDRLAEEKRRGITLELGFAHLTLADGRRVGVVDVPGHERFVKAMVAGAGGIDLAILVVALDEGVMAQTREHLDICRLLGIQKGLIAVTKSDLLPTLGAEWLALIRADLAALTEATFLEDAPVLLCSAHTGEGLDALKGAITNLASELPARPGDGPLLLPIDRAFSLKGFGTVVTGPLLSGSLTAEDEVELLPSALRLERAYRVRGVQVHGGFVEKALAGDRTAVNLAGLDAEVVSRGLTLVRRGELPESRMLDVEVTALPALETAIPRRRKLLLHLGTAQVEATCVLLDRDALQPGESALAQLRLASPIAALPDQHFILRGSRVLKGRGATIAGGRILGINPPKRRRSAAPLLAALRDTSPHEPDARILWHLTQSGAKGRTAAELFALTASPKKALQRALERLSTRSEILLVDRERRLYVTRDSLHQLTARALAELTRFHARAPLEEGLSLEALRTTLDPTLDPKLFQKVLGALTQGPSPKAELAGERVRLTGQSPTLAPDESAARTELLAQIARARLSPPTVNELARGLAMTPSRVVELLRTAQGEGRVQRVSEELYFSSDVLADFRNQLVEHLKVHGSITTQQFKELVGQTRKFVIPLSEYFDREKVTLRVGEKRVLRRA